MEDVQQEMIDALESTAEMLESISQDPRMPMETRIVLKKRARKMSDLVRDAKRKLWGCGGAA